MENYKMETNWGNWTGEAKRAQFIAITNDVTVEFDFNGVVCVVNKDTNIELLWRDYQNSWLMEWKTVGPVCTKDYSDEIRDELKKREDARNEKEREQQATQKIKDNQEIALFEEKVAGIKIELSNEEGWKAGLALNSDPYGACIYEYAERWARLMQAGIKAGKTVHECAEETSHQLGFMGITGFMYGAAVAVLSGFWKYGEDLRKWHNRSYNHEGDGVVNPAVLTISKS